MLRNHGLADVFRSLAMTAPVRIIIDDDRTGRRSDAVEAAIYFCTLEAIQNVIKHAASQAGVRIRIRLRRDAGTIYLLIADNGVGMTTPTGQHGLGLISMRDRIGAVGDQLRITSAPGRGTAIRATIPVPEPLRSNPDETQAASTTG